MSPQPSFKTSKEIQGNNYYQATSKADEEGVHFPELQDAEDTDVCIVGGGLSGLATAIELKRLNYRVVLLEGETIGFGASGRNGGQAIVDVGCGYPKLCQLIGEEKAGNIFRLTVEGIKRIRNNIKHFSIDCDLINGTLTVSQKPRQDKELKEYQKRYQNLGYEVELWDRSQTQKIIDSKLYTGAIYDPHGLHFHPLNYCLGLAREAHRLGVKIYEHSRAAEYNKEGKQIIVRTSKGWVNAGKLVLCANIFNNLNPYLRSQIMPVGTYMAATQPLGVEIASRLITNQAGICDMNFVIDYFRISPDTRLLFGGRVSYSGMEPRNLKQSLYQRMVRVYPEFLAYQPEEIFEYAWGGHADITMNRAPHFGRLSENVFFLQGFSGHGVALTQIAGKVVAEAIDDHPERFDWFADIPHRKFFGGKWLRTPLLALAMIYFRTKDYL